VFIFFIVVLDRVVLNRLQARAFRWRDPIEIEVDPTLKQRVGV